MEAIRAIPLQQNAIGTPSLRGWHYFCGSVENGPRGKATVHRITPTLEIELNPVEHPRQPFPDSAAVQLDFYTELPWILDVPEPE